MESFEGSGGTVYYLTICKLSRHAIENLYYYTILNALPVLLLLVILRERKVFKCISWEIAKLVGGSSSRRQPGHLPSLASSAFAESAARPRNPMSPLLLPARSLRGCSLMLSTGASRVKT